ncbi:MAG: dCMP deaminase family protein [Elusimicrobia bacterium]|nr:dCMP deaminase family protein [Candidatus Obscuribacterium magneticum]
MDCQCLNSSFDEYYMEIAHSVAKRGNCKGSKVGAIIVFENRIVATGYNGTPEKVKNCSDGGCYRCSNRDKFESGEGYDICICVHAEQNALLSAARFGISVEGATVYTTRKPCLSCVKEMLQAKIIKVYFVDDCPIKKEAEDDYQSLINGFECVHQMPAPWPKAA